ncbi:RNA dependent RNA polymerase-domain-containing protein [Trametes maxima]|nr:RNA dependent RNA polymerase-domain-containing protein [Trametes maxima]
MSRSPAHWILTKYLPVTLGTSIILRANPSPDDAEWSFHFILTSFESLRFPDKPASTTRDYKIRLFKAGFHLNGVEYRFYGHSNSQLTTVPGAKRIGLLFSKAEIDWVLDPRNTQDIEDIVVNGENFSDGCGLIAPHFARMLSRRKGTIFHGRPYTPSVYQIRYKGYKGVLMVHPELQKDCVAQFRASQRKFRATNDNTFSVVAYSIPYSYARLNNEIVVLLSSLGITPETFIKRQEEYHGWIRSASSDWQVAFNILCALGHFEAAEKLLIHGIEAPEVQARIRAAQMAEISSFKKKEKFRARMIIPKSRFLFGVCDPYGVLQEGEVFVRISAPRKGATTITNTEVLAVRNPCLHPGDCLKLWAVDHPRLGHLVDCIVFASTGQRAAPSMSAGGDLVIWDPDFVPPKAAESYTYPAPKEHVVDSVSREDLARHFASYNSPKGAMSDQCQDLNALHSLVVDGGSVKIPDRLANPPEDPTSPFILDLLQDSAKGFYDEFIQTARVTESGVDAAAAADVLVGFLTSEKLAVSEFELAMMAARFADIHHIDIHKYLGNVDFSALSTAEKHALSFRLGLTPEKDPYVWNSLMRSEILNPRDLEDRKLGGPLHLQRFYSSSQQGRAAFFDYLREALANFTRRLLILRTDDRFSVGVFLRGEVSWDDDAEINRNVVVCSFMPKASGLMSTYWQGTSGYKLYCGMNVMQLFNKQRADSFIFVTRPPPKSGVDIITSIALDKISQRVQQRIKRLTFGLNNIPPDRAQQMMNHLGEDQLRSYFDLAVHYRVESRVFAVFNVLLERPGGTEQNDLRYCVGIYPSLSYCLLKKYLPEGPASLPGSISPMVVTIIRSMLRCGDAMNIATLAGLERLADDIKALDMGTFLNLLCLFKKFSLCCTIVVAGSITAIRFFVRIHSHVRLQVASVASNSTLPPPIVDAVVTRATRGELYLEVQQPLPPEWQAVDWNLFDAGGVATSAAMLDAIRKLVKQRYEACTLYNVIVGADPDASPVENTSLEADLDDPDAAESSISSTLNLSQRRAVALSPWIMS